MKITKGKLLSLLESNLKEMAMDFTTTDRPDPGVEDKLRTGQTPHKKIPFPSTGDQNKNFQELLASESYKDALQKMRRYTGSNIQVKGMQGMPPLIGAMYDSLRKVLNVESQHARELELLAIKLVIEQQGLRSWLEDAVVSRDGNQTSVTSEKIKITAKITGQIDMSDMDKTLPQNEPDTIDLEKEIATNVDKLNLEKAKRRFVNTMIQGAATTGFYMFHFVEDKLREITGNDQLINNYGILMSVNNLNYWQFSDNQLNAAMGIGGGQGSAAGRARIDRNSDPIEIYAEAITFPALVHEIIKGVMEYLSQPEEDTDFTVEAADDEDKLAHEVWDLRFGSEVWKRVRTSFPEEILIDENQFYLQNYLLSEIFSLPAKKFLVLMKEVMSGSNEGKRLMNNMLESIRQGFQDEDYTENMIDFNQELDELTDNTTDDELNDLLRNLNIDGRVDFDDDEDFEDDYNRI